MRQYPHCDQRILHAPGECDVCDKYAKDLQQLRKDWGINFTGHYDTIDNHGVVMLPCPAEVARPFSILNKWSGNTVKKPGWEEKLANDLKETFSKFILENDQEK
jgi:hypothetical protein